MMDILINHCWCSDSNWGGQYNCETIVTIRRIPEGGDCYSVTEDWKNLVVTDKYRDAIGLKPEVVDWLKESVGGDGWCIGTEEYNKRNLVSFAVFFKRRGNAMRFIKRWSSYKKPYHYCNYFRDIWRDLDSSGRLVRQHR